MANNKYRRTNFTEEVTVDGVLEQDLVDNSWDLFKIKRPMTFFTVGRSYVQRPDLLSIKLYGKQNYWWILAKANPEIQDFWNDLEINSVIQVPSIRDIEDWYAEVRKKRIS